ncbi:hypothetical protein Leryth_021382 [Lithospermum erythrorhizon]|nr:hypothetical protein Leryth_021382 [Lithospermum erythrorhizon]
MAAVSSGNVARKTLADISNLPVQQLVRDGKPHSTNTKDYEQLMKEKMQLMKILADRQKIIEVTGIELQKLRINQQKLQEQNKQLAQSNSHLLAEINANTEKVRALNHDLGCKNGLLKALQQELKSQVKVNVSEEEVKLTGIEERELAARGHDADKQDTCNRRIHSKCLGRSRQVQSKEKAGNKRACVRRQSARFTSKEAESSEDSCEMPETKLVVCPPPTDSDLEDAVACTGTSMKDDDKEGNVAITFCMNEAEVKLTETELPGELATRVQDAKQHTFNRRNQSKSELGPSLQVQSKEKAGNKRACVRRQTARFKSEKAKSSEDFCEIPEMELMVCLPPTDSDLEGGVACTGTTLKDEDKEGNVAISFCMNEEVKLTETELPEELTTREPDVYKRDTVNRRNQSKSLGPSREVLSKEKAGNKRACVTRQSARFKSEEAESMDDFCEIPEKKVAACSEPRRQSAIKSTDSVWEDGVATMLTTVKDEDKEGNAANRHEPGRPSIGRPSRVAARKVQSYKEIPLSVKMRRPD